jgi:hypothetical protein
MEEATRSYFYAFLWRDPVSLYTDAFLWRDPVSKGKLHSFYFIRLGKVTQTLN